MGTMGKCSLSFFEQRKCFLANAWIFVRDTRLDPVCFQVYPLSLALILQLAPGPNYMAFSNLYLEQRSFEPFKKVRATLNVRKRQSKIL
jgi:hypothetical protein